MQTHGRLEVGVAKRNDGEPDSVYFRLVDTTTGETRIMYLTPDNADSLAAVLQESARECRGAN